MYVARSQDFDLCPTNAQQANRGIGLGIAEVCLANSAKMIYSLDLMDPGEDFAALKKKYPNLNYIQTDVTEDSSLEKAIDQIVAEEGRTNGLVANAGMTKHQPALEFTREQVGKLFNLNVSLEILNTYPEQDGQHVFSRSLAPFPVHRLLRANSSPSESKAALFSLLP